MLMDAEDYECAEDIKITLRGSIVIRWINLRRRWCFGKCRRIEGKTWRSTSRGASELTIAQICSFYAFVWVSDVWSQICGKRQPGFATKL